MNYKIKTLPNSHFREQVDLAKTIATEKDVIVEFKFNEIIILIDKNTDRDLVYRDYDNAFIMEWKTIGVKYDKEQSSELKHEIIKRKKDSKIIDALNQIDKYLKIIRANQG